MSNSLPDLLKQLKNLSNDTTVPAAIRLKAQELQNELLKAIASPLRSIDRPLITQTTDFQARS